MKHQSNHRRRFFAAKTFGLIIGLVSFLIFFFIGNQFFLGQIQEKVRDLQMQFRDRDLVEVVQAGAKKISKNPNISEDIVIATVDNQSLIDFGFWPWPRYRHADLLNNLARIKDHVQRESSVMPDFFFFDGSSDPGSDVALQKAIKNNGKTFLEGILVDDIEQSIQDLDNKATLNALFEKHGSILNVTGDYHKMRTFYSMISPVLPFLEVMKGYGHANFRKDSDDIFRRQILVAKIAFLEEALSLDQLNLDYFKDLSPLTRLSWIDKDNKDIPIIPPKNQLEFDALKIKIETESPPLVEDLNDDTILEKSYLVYRANLVFVPSITLSLALNYFDVPLSAISVELGSHITVPNPTIFDKVSGKRIPYKDRNGKEQSEIQIPINEKGEMVVNFMGPRSQEPDGDYQTFTVRRYSAYARPSSIESSNWPPTQGLQNTIVLGGAFSNGMADDEKNTPMGLMFGVEMHANALNTIIMSNYIQYLPEWANALLLFLLIGFTTLLSTRISPLIALFSNILIIVGFFVGTLFLFDATSISIDFIQPSLAILFTTIVIIVYRVMTEEKEKKRIQTMFGKYVAPQVVSQLIEVEPELGGLDKELTVLFSDIRGFTTLSELMSPQELVNHLNIYLGAMTDVIHEYYGTLDKYVGDEIMCFWGAPLPQLDHALLACKCALRQMEKLAELNAQWPVDRRLDIGIGLNSGIMTVGNMGSAGRMNYTLMGDNVNLGARLEGTNKTYMTHIIISEYTYGLVKDHVIARELDNIRVKGKNKPVVIYELVGMRE